MGEETESCESKNIQHPQDFELVNLWIWGAAKDLTFAFTDSMPTRSSSTRREAGMLLAAD
jgi:hypothetical protein